MDEARDEREQQPYEGEEVSAESERELEDELPDVPGVTPADDPPDQS